MILVTCSVPKIVYRTDANERPEIRIESIYPGDNYDAIREPNGDYAELQPQRPSVTYNTLALPRPADFGDYLDIRGSQ